MKYPAATTRGKTPRAAVATTTAANPLATGRSAHAQAARWMPYVDHDVLAAATRTAWWPRWLEIATAESATLTAPGDEPGDGLATALAELGPIDEYQFVVHTHVAGRGPTLLAGLSRPLQLELVDRQTVTPVVVASRYVPRT